MNRKETTKFLSDLLIKERLSGRGKYYAREVSIDYGTTNVKRVDFMQFEPAGVVHQSDIEKGIFTCYEVKSCKEDVYSGRIGSLNTQINFLESELQKKDYIFTKSEEYALVGKPLSDYDYEALSNERDVLRSKIDALRLELDAVVNEGVSSY